MRGPIDIKGSDRSGTSVIALFCGHYIFFQKDEGLFLTKFVLKIFCCIVSKNYLQKISDTHWQVANDLEDKNIQLYYVNLLYFDKNIVLGLMLAVSYLNLAHTHYAY